MSLEVFRNRINLFTSENMSEERYVWHPDVHKYYKEYLYFWLIKGEFHVPDAVSYIKPCLINSGIISFCIYDLFGYYDCLVRVWLTNQKRARFFENLKKLDLEVIQVISCEDLDYLWAKNIPAKLPEEEIGFKIDVIRQLNSGENVDPITIKKLEDSFFIIRKSSNPDHYIKAYICLSKNPLIATQRYEVEAIRNQVLEITEKNESIRQPTLYKCYGTYSYFLKVVSENYNSLVAFIKNMGKVFEDHYLSSTTLLLFGPDAYESDVIDTEWTEYTQELTRLESVIGSVIGYKIDKLSQKERQILSSEFGEIARYYNKDTLDIIKGLFIGYLNDDPYVLFEKLYFIHRLESLLRIYTVEILKKLYINEWFNKCIEFGRKVGVPHDYIPTPSEYRPFYIGKSEKQNVKGKKNYTLHHFLAVLNKLEKDDIYNVTKDLGGSWFEHIESSKDFRNLYAHGELNFHGDDRQVDLKIWRNVISIIKDLLFHYNKLIEFEKKTL